MAIVPLAIASWAVVRLVSHNELNTTDANLLAVARVARAEYGSQLSAKRADATKLAVWPEVQRAVLRHDIAYLRAFQRNHPFAGFLVAGKLLRATYKGPGEPQFVRVGDTGSKVSMLLPLDAKLLARMNSAAGIGSRASKTQLELIYAGGVVSGTLRPARLVVVRGDARYVPVDGKDYRVLRLRISRHIPASVAAVRSRSDIDTASGSNWWRAFWAALATLATVAVLAYLVAPLVAGRRWVRRLLPRELEEQYAVEADTQEPIAAPVASHGTAPANGRAASPPVEAATSAVRRRVVIIDDDPEERALIGDALGSDSLDIAATGEAEHGLALLGETPADLAILDWKMSGRSGAEILAELNIRHPDVPVLLVADELEPQQRHVATLLGAEDFLTRPLDSAVVGAKTRRLLERTRTAGAAS